MCMFCRSLFVLLYVFIWSLCCLFFFDKQILITPLVSSNSSFNLLFLYIGFLMCILNVFSYFIIIHGCVNRLVQILCLFICSMVHVRTCLTALSTIFQLHRGGNFIDGGNRRTGRKPPTSRKSLTNFIT